MEEKQTGIDYIPNENIIQQYPEDIQEDIRRSLEFTEDDVFNFIFKLIM